MSEAVDRSRLQRHVALMKQVSIDAAKRRLSELIDEAAAGEDIVIAKGGRPYAMLTGLSPTTAASERTSPPPRFGAWDHLGWSIPVNFDDPDPEIEAMFHGDPETNDEGADR